MKKVILFALATAAMFSCSQNKEVEVIDGDNVLIRLGAGVEALTKAPIISGSTFTAAIGGWETDEVVDYTVAVTWATTAEIEAEETAAAISMAAQKYYNVDNDVKTYMKAWCPEGTLEAGMVTFTNTDGTVDPLLATAVSGSKLDAGTKEFSFAHPTTQIKFKVVAGTGLAIGTEIQSITIKNAELPTGFNLVTDVVTYEDEGAADLSVLTGGTTEITSSAALVGTPVMIKPMTGNEITLDVVTSGGVFDGVVATIADDTNFVAGKAYTITLTFKAKGIDVTASVAEWTTGTGTGDVE